MTPPTKAAELADLIAWHEGQACHSRYAANAGTAVKHEEPRKGMLLKQAEFHDKVAALLRASEGLAPAESPCQFAIDGGGNLFEVRIAGPDDVIPFADELSAHRHANAVNQQHVADCLKHPDDHVLCVAIVHAAKATGGKT